MNIEKSLYSLQDKKYQEFQKGLCPGVVNIIGVRIPELRKLAKELLENINDNYYEELMLQGMVIGGAKEDINTILKYVKEFVPKIDNWAVCDTFCTSLKITKKYKKEMWKFIQEYLKSDKEFELRFAIVMILGYFIDEVISLYTGNIPYYQTRIFNWGQMLKNLSNGIPVPVRVQNSIFRNDESRLGGYYVNLIGFKEKMAITVDSATEGGIYKLPVEQFLKSLIYEAVMISVWNASK